MHAHRHSTTAHTRLTHSLVCSLTFVHYQLAIALRKGPYQVNLLIGGFDATPKAADEDGDAATTAADGSATDSKDDVVAGEPSL